MAVLDLPIKNKTPRRERGVYNTKLSKNSVILRQSQHCCNRGLIYLENFLKNWGFL